MENYPKTVKIKDGSSVVIRPLARDDVPALLAFFRALPAEDRLFLREDVTRQEVIDKWISKLDYDQILPLVAEKGSAIIGDATLHISQYGWHRHMAEIRCVVARGYQKKGLGTLLMHELVAQASQRNVDKIRAEMMDTQISAQIAFRKLGFKKEAELKNFVIDMEGKSHNLVIMVNDVSELWKKMEDLLIDYDFSTEH
jgi:ribosomal protein S18 acetylase RimI-like enzyme